MKQLKRIVIGALFLFVLWIGGYVGYLSALVDIDEQQFIARVRAATDEARLERELARAKSILDARKRAYERRAQEFLVAQRQFQQTGALESERLVEDIGPNIPVESEGDTTVPQESSVMSEEEVLNQVPAQIAQQQLQTMEIALQEEADDLQFFEDQVEVIEQLLERGFNDEDLETLVAGARDPRRFTGSIELLFQLLDKRQELVQEREVAQDAYSFWRLNAQSAPSDVNITVNNKDGKRRELNPVHVTQISTALSIMPQSFDGRLKNLYVVYGDPKMRRGLSGVGVVFMKGEELDFFRVLVHELGHIYDLHREVQSGEKSGFYDGKYRLYAADPSVEYFSYGWINNYERRVGNTGFASAYGMTDPFEDFAEAYALYILQGETFRRWAEQDTTMRQKYDFIRRAFDGREFPSITVYQSRPYDVTMLTVDYQRLLVLNE